MLILYVAIGVGENRCTWKVIQLEMYKNHLLRKYKMVTKLKKKLNIIKKIKIKISE